MPACLQLQRTADTNASAASERGAAAAEEALAAQALALDTHYSTLLEEQRAVVQAAHARDMAAVKEAYQATIAKVRGHGVHGGRGGHVLP